MSSLAELVVAAPAPGAGRAIGFGTTRFVVQIAVPVTIPVAARWGSSEWTTDSWSIGAGVWGISTWGTDAWSGGFEWLDLTDRWRGGTWTRGRSGLNSRPDIGTAACDLENSDGYLSPWNTASTFPSRRYLSPGTAVRLGYLDGAVWTPAFTGEIDDLTEHAVELDADLWVTLSLVETLGRLAGVNRPAQAAQGDGDGQVERYTRLLDDAGWPYGIHGFAGSLFSARGGTFAPTTMAQNRLGELYLAADTALEVLYTDRDGRVLWRDGDAPSQLGGATFMVFGEEASAGVAPFAGSPLWPQVPWVSAPESSVNRDDVINLWTAARVGGTAVTVADDSSIGLNREQGSQQLDLLANEDAYVAVWVGQMLVRTKDRSRKLSGFAIDAAMSDESATVMPFLDHQAITYVMRDWARWPGLYARTAWYVRIIGYTVSLGALGAGAATWGASLDVAVEDVTEV